MRESSVIAEARKPEGHLVQLHHAAWQHVLHQHVEMEDYLEQTMAAVSSPDCRDQTCDLDENATSAAQDHCAGFAS